MVPGVILAAGRSCRMGYPKAFLPIGSSGETFINRIVRTLRQGGVGDVLVVVNESGLDVAEAFKSERNPPHFVVNRTPEFGQLSSLQIGLRVVDRPGVSGMLVTLVDVPLIDSEAVRILLESHRLIRPPVVRLVRHGRHGHPVIFDRSVFKELRQAKEDEGDGARAIIRAHRADVVEITVKEDGPFLDIDTPADYEKVFKRPVPVGTDPTCG